MKVFGPHGEGIISSGDPVNDANQRNKFVEAYDAKHQIETKDDNNATLIIGEKDWPFPVPLVKKDNGWRFDTEAGLKEILFRRIGNNELDTIQSLLAYVDAQNDYAQITSASTGTATYAQRIISQPGKKDGLRMKSESRMHLDRNDPITPAQLGQLLTLASIAPGSALGVREHREGRVPALARGCEQKAFDKQKLDVVRQDHHLSGRVVLGDDLEQVSPHAVTRRSPSSA